MAIIAKATSRSVAFKAVETEGQDESLARSSERAEVDVETNSEALLEDVGQDADLRVANQEANAQP